MPQTQLELIRERLTREPVRCYMPIERAATDVAAADSDSRTVRLAFASDLPIDGWMGPLILTTKKMAVRTERMDLGLALLEGHDRDKHIGIVENFSFDPDGIIRGDARFSRSPEGEAAYQDVLDGIKRFTSVGAALYEIHVDNEKDGVITYRSDDWEPVEISLVAVPADIAVGVGRSLETATQVLSTVPPLERENSTSTSTEITMDNENTPVTPVVETTTRSANEIAADEVARWGVTLGCPELATQYTRNAFNTNAAISVDAFRAFVVATEAATPTPSLAPPAPADQARREGGIQLARTVPRVALRSFKGEGAQERAYRSGMHLAAVLMRDERAIAYCRENGINLTRTQTEGDNTKGGYTVLPEFEQTIFDLRLQYGVARRVADVVPMSGDQKIVTRRTGGLTAYAVGPHTRGTFSDVTDDQFELVARKWMVLNKREDELTEDSFISWADRLAEESAYAFSYAEDNCLFNADGSSTYHGIVGLTSKILGLSATRANIASAVVASGNAWSEIVIGDLLNVVGKLPSFARSSGNVRWYCTSEFWATVLQRLALAAGGATHAEFEGELKETFLGKPVEIVEAMQHTEANDTIPLLYGNISQAATFGDRRGITVKTTDSNDTDFESDLEATKATERFDINVHDVGNASATAGLRKAGPVIALLTAAS